MNSEKPKNFKLSLKRNPSNYQAKFNLGLSYQKLGIFDKALLQYSKCQPTHEVLFNSGLIQFVEKAIKLKQDKLEYWYHLGINYYFIDNITETANCFEKVVALGGLWIIEDNNISHPAVIQYRQQFIKTNSLYQLLSLRPYLLFIAPISLSNQIILKSSELNCTFLQSKLELAKVYESLKQYKESILIYKAINNQQSYQQLSLLLSHLQLHNGAIYTLNKILETDPKNVEALYNKGLSLSQLHQFVPALQCFEDILRYFQKAITLKQLNENEKAHSQFKRYQPSLLKMNQFTFCKQYNEARSAYEKAIEINNSFNEAYFGLGFIHYTTKEYQLSIKVYKQYLMQCPKSKQFLLALANSFHKLGKHKTALKKLDEILIQDKYSSEAINCRAIIYYDLKNFKQSFINFYKAIHYKPRQNELLKFVYNS